MANATVCRGWGDPTSRDERLIIRRWLDAHPDDELAGAMRRYGTAPGGTPLSRAPIVSGPAVPVSRAPVAYRLGSSSSTA